MANKMDDVLKDPDFWGAETTDEDRKWTLGKVDKKFDSYDPAAKDRFISNLTATRNKQKQEQEAEIAGRKAEIEPMKATQQTKWEQMVAPVTNAVGMGMEAATEPLVPLARLMQGEGMQSFSPEGRGLRTVGHGGTAASTRQQAGAGIVPQSPWQAGAMGAQAIPGVGSLVKAAPALGRIGASAMGAGGLQGLLGSQGLLEGGTNAQALGEAGVGAAKGAGTQAGGEVLGKMLGGATRIPGTGRGKRIANADNANVQKAVGEISPEFAGQGKSAAQAGTFFKGTKGAKDAAGAKFEQGIDKLEQTLIRETGQPYINTIGLQEAYKKLEKATRKELYAGEIQKLRPSAQGFIPSQVAEILKLSRENLHMQPTAMGHTKAAGLKSLIDEIEASLPPSAQGILTSTREGFAKASGLQELLGGSFDTSKKGYGFNIRKLQEALSDNPELLDRLGDSELKKLFAAATRNASKGPGFADKAPGGNVSIPYPSWQGGTVAALRNVLSSGKTVGELPGTLSPRMKQLLGVGMTSQASVQTRRNKD